MTGPVTCAVRERLVTPRRGWQRLPFVSEDPDRFSNSYFKASSALSHLLGAYRALASQPESEFAE